MDINAISSIKVPTIAVNKQAAGTTLTSVQKTDSANDTQKSGINYKKAAPYIAGAVILAGLGVYFGRKRLVKGVKIKPKEPVNPAGEVPKPGSTAKAHAPEVSNPSASSAPKAPEKPQAAETKPAADAPKAPEIRKNRRQLKPNLPQMRQKLRKNRRQLKPNLPQMHQKLRKNRRQLKPNLPQMHQKLRKNRRQLKINRSHCFQSQMPKPPKLLLKQKLLILKKQPPL